MLQRAPKVCSRGVIVSRQCETFPLSCLSTHRHLCSDAPHRWRHQHNARKPNQVTEWDLTQSGQGLEAHRPDLHLVLVNPQIPENTGTIARTCAATAVGLHLVGPLGYEINSTRLKRAGLDYWPKVVVEVHDCWQAFQQHWDAQPDPKRMHAFTKFSQRSYSLPGTYQPGDWLLFGSETQGLPKEVRAGVELTGGYQLKIPIIDTHVRSLNLAVSAGVGMYEAIRQLSDGA